VGSEEQLTMRTLESVAKQLVEGLENGTLFIRGSEKDAVKSAPELIAEAHDLGIPSTFVHDVLKEQGEAGLQEVIDLAKQGRLKISSAVHCQRQDGTDQIYICKPEPVKPVEANKAPEAKDAKKS
jgi:hypothetical protein